MGEHDEFAGDDEFLDEEEEALLDERDRVDARPGEEFAPPGLSRFEVRVEGPVEEYAARLRAVIGTGLDRAVLAGRIDSRVVPRPVPEWFAAVCGEAGAGGEVPGFARRGAERYAAAGHGEGWSLEGWLWRLELDCPFRTWAWWDLTPTQDRTLSLWVDAGGEDFFACDDLRWAAYTAGAETVSGPTLVGLEGWRSRPSI